MTQPTRSPTVLYSKGPFELTVSPSGEYEFEFGMDYSFTMEDLCELIRFLFEEEIISVKVL